MREFRSSPALRLLFALFATFNLECAHAAEPARSAETARPNPVALEEALKRFRVAPGLKVDLFAAEPLIANPVCFTFDSQGRAYVVETHRRRTSAYDINFFPEWLDADLSFRTVEDRSNFLKKILVPENKKLPSKIIRDLNHDGQFDYRDLEVESERIRLLEDRNADGRADHAVTFADGFNTIVSGLAAGILVRGSNVWFTCVPDLWLLRDNNGDGQADERKVLHHGFGVHIGSGGHDLHGLRFGPDGKLYFSVADRGFHVTIGDRTIAHPDSGAVLRCNPDGSELEVFATGLRNPQELAFDQFGNLWTGDNNGDGGDKARWVYVVEGSDSGWQIGWQNLPKLGAWNSEKLWELAPLNTAAYIVPPVGHIGHGPAGVAFYPGTGLPVRYDNHFFLCDFPGGVWSFGLRPKGAAYEVIDLQEFLGGLYPVDVEFGPEGGAYVADWIEGWEKTERGRIYRVYDPAVAQDKLVRETKKLLAEGMQKRSPRELVRLLEHVDMRVRLDAQFALAEKGLEVTNRLARVAEKNDRLVARLHAIWALGQIGRTNPIALAYLLPLLADADAEVRAQVAKVLGDQRLGAAYEPLISLLRDPSPRVRFFAALGIGKLGHQEATEPMFQLALENADRDPFIRHAAVMSLVWLNDMNALISAAKETSASIRMVSLLAMRKLQRPEIAMFLYDANPALVLEAARAIYDLPIESALTQVAGFASKPQPSEAIMRRALNANLRLGKLENALALAEFAARDDQPESLRAEALDLLALWPNPPGRDRVLGLWRPLQPREARSANLALRSELPKLLRQAPDAVRVAAVRAVVPLQMTQASPMLFELVANTNVPAVARVESLQALEGIKDPKLPEAIGVGLTDSSELVRKEATRLHAKLYPSDALGKIADAIEKGSVAEKQSALKTLASLDNSVADQVLLLWLDLLQTGRVPKELQLDLLEAARQRKATPLKTKLEQYDASRPKDDALAAYREVLYGGDATAGKKIFFERVETACLRCHKIKGEGGELGPDLTGIGSKLTRDYLLESILFPSKQIARGYENVTVRLKNGSVFAGQVKNETERELLLITTEEGLVVLAKDEIVSRERGLSAMPEMTGFLSKRELRDLIEFLANLK